MSKCKIATATEAKCQSVEDFLATGGQITEVPPGESGEDDKNYNWNRSHYKIRKLADVKRSPVCDAS